MTNESVTYETTLVNPSVTTTTAADLKRVLHSSNASSTLDHHHHHQEEHLENVALVQEEEKLMDEEVTSVEDNQHEEEEEGGEEISETSVEKAMMAVALAKSVVETISEDCVVGATDTMVVKVEEDEHGSGTGVGSRYGLRKRRRQSGQALERLEELQSLSDGGLARVTDRKLAVAHAPPEAVSSASFGPPSVTRKVGRPHSAPRRYKTDAPLVLPCVSSIAAPLPSVPNPLASISESCSLDETTRTDVVALPTPVPCPLPALSSQDDLELKGDMNLEISDKRKVTIAEPVLSGNRIRGFSIDMDLGLDFDDDNSESGPGGPDIPVSRDRAYSFECFAFGINADEPLPPIEQSSSMHIQSCSDAGSTGTRPRGDSIIFDPSSFQDGGIHEQNALEKARGRTNSLDMSALLNVSSSHSSAKPSTVYSSSSCIGVTPDYPAVPAAVASPTVASSTTSTSIVVSTTGTLPSVSLDLVNKDGRIGIYLPEARRARIARFHAKRAKRIWRKRIKYDCRKKLADSRPRIKGRFVKRSDMDED